MSDSTINDLMSKMSLGGKVSQVIRYCPWGELNPELIRQGKAGAVFGGINPPDRLFHGASE